MDILNFDLTDKNNYYSSCKWSFNEILFSYVKVINNFLLDMNSSNIKTKNEIINNIIEIKGINCLTIIFCYSLYNSNNLLLVETIVNNATVYFIEFITQIKKINQSGINYNDVFIFVYKKTINNVLETSYSYEEINKLEILIQIHNYLLINYKLTSNELNHWINTIKHFEDLNKFKKIYDSIVLNRIDLNNLITNI
jgi:hypothetical protein